MFVINIVTDREHRSFNSEHYNMEREGEVFYVNASSCGEGYKSFVKIYATEVGYIEVRNEGGDTIYKETVANIFGQGKSDVCY